MKARGPLNCAALQWSSSPRPRVVAFDAEQWLEVVVAVSRKQTRAGRAFAVPLFGIVVLLLCYWILADWQDVPAMLTRALASLRWPR